MTALYKVVECNGYSHIETVDGRSMGYDLRAEDARFIVACMNKFDDMSVEDIEQLPADVPTLLTRLSERSRELDKMVKQRNALLRLVKQIRNNGAWYCSALEFDHDVDGEELLAKVERYIEAIDK